MRRIFGNGRRTLAATPAPKRETRFGPPVGVRCPCPRSLKASRKTSPLHRFRPFPGYGACRFRRACAVKRMAEAVSGFSREDKATAMRVLSLSGKPSASRSGSAVSTLIRKVSGLRRYRPGRFLGGGDDERGTLGREAALHISARVRGRHGALAGCFPRCGPRRRRCRATRIARKTLEPRPARGHRSRRRIATGHVRRLTPKRRGPRGFRPNPARRARLNPASARHYPAWPCSARFVRASCSAARLSPSRF